jgi:subtilisin-like proprotein convertase family protein
LQTGELKFKGDVNLYSIELTAVITYAFSVNGTTLANPFLELMDVDGTTVTSDDDDGSGLNAYQIYKPTTTGTYYLAVRESGNDAIGSYSFKAWKLPTVSISDASIVEGNTGATSLVFTLSLSEASSERTSISVGTSGTSTATENVDYSQYASTVVFEAGQRTATFRVDVLADTLFEPTEILYANLSNPVGLIINDGTGMGTIRDNDSLYSTLPSDSFLPFQWHLFDKTGINVFPVWLSYTGKGVRVAVFDSGVDSTNTDLTINVLTSLGRNASNLSAGGAPLQSSDNHGTAVAGVIAASANNYRNVGVAFDSKIVSIFSNYLTSDIANAFTYAQKFEILNNSWGYGGAFTSGTNWAFYDDFSKEAFKPAAAALKALADTGRGGLGTVVVQSAGNGYGFGDDTNLHNFQNSRYIITVGATDYLGRSSSYSTTGASILVSAPGGNGSDPYNKIITTDRAGAAGYSAEDYTFINGTSFSAPVVSGIVALMLEANYRLGYRDIQEILAYSARKTDSANNTWAYNGTVDWNGGGLHFDSLSHDLGFGLVDALAAVRLAETWGSKAKTSANVFELTYSSAPRIRIPDYSAASGTGRAFDTIQVTGNMRIERVEVTLDITHSWIGDLSVLLLSPTSESSSFLIGRPGSGALSAYGSSQDNIHFTLNTVLNWGEQSAGAWRLGVFDSAGGSVGTLDKWTIKFIGSQVSNDNIYIYTSEFSESLSDQASRKTLTDSSGTDTINASAITSHSSIDLTPGSNSSVDGASFSIAVGTLIENAFGGDGNDALRGNSASNELFGMRGNDAIDGGAGDDHLFGGEGNDALDGGEGSDTLHVSGSARDYQVRYIAAKKAYSIEAMTGFDGKDTFKNIEFIQYSDQLIPLSLIDYSPPTITVFADKLILSPGQQSFITFLLSEPSTSFEASDVVVTGGTLSNFSGAGNTYTATFSPLQNLQTVAKISVISGKFSDTFGNLNEDGSDANNSVSIQLLSSANPPLTGNELSETFKTSKGNDSINGGDGIDTVLVAAGLGNYSVTKTATGYVLFDNTGSDGTDTLVNIEAIKFSDKTINLTVQAKAASAPQADVTRLVELYTAFFNRVPDADGMSFWIDEMKAGKTTNQVAEAFYNAGVNYSSLTGFSSTMTNADFINVIYKNVLGRKDGADAGGLSYWEAEITTGNVTRGILVSSILDSAHTFKGNTTWGWVADLLDNKITVAKKFSIDMGLNYNTPEESIMKGMAIASAITSTDTTAAITLIGVLEANLGLT